MDSSASGAQVWQLRYILTRGRPKALVRINGGGGRAKGGALGGLSCTSHNTYYVISTGGISLIQVNRRLPLFAKPVAMTRLQRGIAIAIGTKLLLLGVLYALFFSPAHRPPTDPGDVAGRMLPTR